MLFKKQSLSRRASASRRRNLTPAWLTPEENLEERVLLSAVYGDFDNNGYDDLAVGAPGESVNGNAGAGAVNVFYAQDDGSGLGFDNDQFLHRGILWVQGTPQAGDGFGTALAVGDFNGDGFEDLAIGLPGAEGPGGIENAGAVAIQYGGAYDPGVGGSVPTRGLNSDGSGELNQFFYQGEFGLSDVAEVDDRFGSVLAAGDFNADGYSDLAIGVPYENVGNLNDAGVVQIVFGSADGLDLSEDQFLVENDLITENGMTPGVSTRYNFFGAALAVGNFNGDEWLGNSIDDLAIGTPGETFGVDRTYKGTDGVTYSDHKAVEEAGLVYVVSGVVGGQLNIGKAVSLSENPANVPYPPQAYDEFGASLAAGDINGDSKDDLAIGAPGKAGNSGVVHVFYGDDTQLITTTGNQYFTQNTSGVEDFAERGDRFGEAVALGDFNGDGFADLAVGVPGESVNGNSAAGAINLLVSDAAPDGRARITASNDRLIFQGSGNYEGSAELGDAFGASLAVGFVNSGIRADLAVGVPGENVNGNDHAGGVQVFYGTTDPVLLQAGNDLQILQSTFGVDGSNSNPGDQLGGVLPLGEKLGGTKVPELSSNPGASKTLYLNFQKSRTLFQGYFTDSPVFDLDGNPNYFNRRELAIIQDTFRTVAEDYAPFDINVTTVDPGTLVIGESLQVAIGGQYSIVHDPIPATGLTETGGFKDVKLSSTALVFSDTVYDLSFAGQDLAGMLGTTISHEAGHGFGLNHKSLFDSRGRYITEYAPGNGVFTPIMGNNLATNRTIWTQNIIVLPNGQQIKGDNDFAVLSQALGLREDDHGDSQDTATDLGTIVAGQTIVVKGLIGTVSDYDFFQFTLNNDVTNLSIELRRADVSANLNGFATLYRVNASGDLSFVANTSPLDATPIATILQSLDAGHYVVRIESQGVFTGDVGEYTLRVTNGDVKTPLPISTGQLEYASPTLNTGSPSRVTSPSAGSISTSEVLRDSVNLSSTTKDYPFANEMHESMTSREKTATDIALQNRPSRMDLDAIDAAFQSAGSLLELL